MAMEPPPAQQESDGHHRKKKKGAARNIFLEFGMDSDARATRKVEIGGIVIERSNVSRFWQSDTDLRRWQRGLGDNTRHERLLTDVRSRTQPDFYEDRREMCSKHGHSRRDRDWSATSHVEARANAAQELRELRRRLEPREAKKAKKPIFGTMDFSGLFGGGNSIGLSLKIKDEPEVEEADPAEAHAALGKLLEWMFNKHGSLEASFDAIDEDKSGEVSLPEFTAACEEMGYHSDVICLMRMLDKSSDGNLSRAEFMRLAPFMPKVTPVSSRRQSIDADPVELQPCDFVEEPAAKSRDVKVGGCKLSVPIPKTVALLVFRNADANHPGEPVLVRRWPPKSMEELLKLCSDVVKPLVPPGVRLYGADLRAVKFLDELAPGAAYLIRGQEGLEPPPLFFRHNEVAAAEAELHAEGEEPTSLRKMALARHALVADLQDCSRGPGRSLPPIAGSADWAEPPVGGPPRGPTRAPRPPEKWVPEAGLTMYLMPGGLGHPPTHRHYGSWPRALEGCPGSAPSRSIDRGSRSMSSTL